MWLGFGQRKEHADTLLVDVRPVADMVCDVRDLPFEDNSFDGVEFHHVLEHLAPQDAIKALKEIYRVTRKELEISCPDMEACARTILAGNLLVLLNVYSPHEEEAQHHRWGYTKYSLKSLLEFVGFKDIREMPITEIHEMRFSARK